MLPDCSHDSVNRFLLRERFEPKDLFDALPTTLRLRGGVLSADDTVIEKQYSCLERAELITFHWSGKHKRPIKGINLITLYYTDDEGQSYPVNYRIYDPTENKTKNDYLREMLAEVLAWGLKPDFITTDTWYSSQLNLRFFRDKKLGFMVGLAKNRQVRLPGQKYCRIDSLEIPQEGLVVELKKFGRVKVFTKTHKDGSLRYAAVYHFNEAHIPHISREEYRTLRGKHWGIECYHRALKQLCGLGRFMVRISAAIRTHIFSSISAFVRLEALRVKEEIAGWYEVQRSLHREVVRQFILGHGHSSFPVA